MAALRASIGHMGSLDGEGGSEEGGKEGERERESLTYQQYSIGIGRQCTTLPRPLPTSMHPQWQKG